jgi:hypothetical protein
MINYKQKGGTNNILNIKNINILELSENKEIREISKFFDPTIGFIVSTCIENFYLFSINKVSEVTVACYHDINNHIELSKKIHDKKKFNTYYLGIYIGFNFMYNNDYLPDNKLIDRKEYLNELLKIKKIIDEDELCEIIYIYNLFINSSYDNIKTQKLAKNNDEDEKLLINSIYLSVLWNISTNKKSIYDYYLGILDVFNYYKNKDYKKNIEEKTFINLLAEYIEEKLHSESFKERFNEKFTEEDFTESTNYYIFLINFYKQYKGNIITLEQQRYVDLFNNTISYPDCGEISLKNFIKLLVFDANGELNKTKLMLLDPIPEVVEFFCVFNTDILHTSEEKKEIYNTRLNARNAWGLIINNRKNVKYVRSTVINDLKYDYELDTGLNLDETELNMLTLIKQLFKSIKTLEDLQCLFQLNRINIEIDVTGFGNINGEYKNTKFKWQFTPGHYEIEYDKETMNTINITNIDYNLLSKFHHDMLYYYIKYFDSLEDYYTGFNHEFNYSQLQQTRTYRNKEKNSLELISKKNINYICLSDFTSSDQLLIIYCEIYELIYNKIILIHELNSCKNQKKINLIKDKKYYDNIEFYNNLFHYFNSNFDLYYRIFYHNEVLLDIYNKKILLNLIKPKKDFIIKLVDMDILDDKYNYLDYSYLLPQKNLKITKFNITINHKHPNLNLNKLSEINCKKLKIYNRCSHEMPIIKNNKNIEEFEINFGIQRRYDEMVYDIERYPIYNQAQLTESNLPENLIKLEISYYNFDIHFLPQNILQIILKNCKTTLYYLPPKLLTLELINYNTQLLPNILPESLKSLKIENYKKSLPNDFFPPNLTELIITGEENYINFYVNYTEDIRTKKLPLSLTEITLPPTYYLIFYHKFRDDWECQYSKFCEDLYSKLPNLIKLNNGSFNYKRDIKKFVDDKGRELEIIYIYHNIYHKKYLKYKKKYLKLKNAE